jgi:hypothetical protein
MILIMFLRRLVFIFPQAGQGFLRLQQGFRPCHQGFFRLIRGGAQVVCQLLPASLVWGSYAMSNAPQGLCIL